MTSLAERLGLGRENAILHEQVPDLLAVLDSADGVWPSHRESQKTKYRAKTVESDDQVFSAMIKSKPSSENTKRLRQVLRSGNVRLSTISSIGLAKLASHGLNAEDICKQFGFLPASLGKAFFEGFESNQTNQLKSLIKLPLACGLAVDLKPKVRKELAIAVLGIFQESTLSNHSIDWLELFIELLREDEEFLRQASDIASLNQKDEGEYFEIMSLIYRQDKHGKEARFVEKLCTIESVSL